MPVLVAIDLMPSSKSAVMMSTMINSSRYVKRVGLLSDRNYSYVGQPSACRALNESRVKVDEIYGFDQDEEDIASWIATRGPVSIGRKTAR